VGIVVLRRTGDLGDDLVLAPERYHPGRAVAIPSSIRLADLVDVLTRNSAISTSDERPVLVLDTSHAYEGFVICRHRPVTASEIGSSKRLVRSGDVIVSRLRPYLRQVAYVDLALFRQSPKGNHVVVSTEFFVLRGRGGFPAAALVPFLLSEPIQAALAAGQEGGHYPRFSRDLLASLRVPDRLVAQANATARRIRALSRRLRRSLQDARALIAEVQSLVR